MSALDEQSCTRWIACLDLSRNRTLPERHREVPPADVPIDWDIPENRLPYPTLRLNVGDSVTFQWKGLHGVYLLENGRRGFATTAAGVTHVTPWTGQASSGFFKRKLLHALRRQQRRLSDVL